MIGRILYRENVHGVLNYVFGKEGRIILGFKNTFSQKISQKLFTDLLHFQGQRHGSANRYVHITLNLPHGEHLNDPTFYRLAQDYMNEMGYGGQPYVVIKHTDTIHDHLHVVSTTINEDGSMVNISNDYRRNIAVQKYLEKNYGLSPSPETRSQRNLPMYRLPQLQFSADETNGTKFYMQDVINTMLQRYKVQSFDQLAFLLKPYHIVLRTMTNEKGRVGVAYGIDNQKKYKTHFINGYTVHPRLSGPKLSALFVKNARSKLLPMHKKRLEKQLATTFKLFKSIRYEDLPDVLKSCQNIDCQLQYDKKQQLMDFVIFDKSGYVFKASEIGNQADFMNQSRLSDNQNGETRIDDDGKQFLLEIRKLIKNAFKGSYLHTNKSKMLLSEFVMSKNLKDMLPIMAGSESFSFLHHYLESDNSRTLTKAIQEVFEDTRLDLCDTESKREIKGLEDKVELVKKVLEREVFDCDKNKDVTFNLLQSLGLKYGNGSVSYFNSNQYSLPIDLGRIRLPAYNNSYISTGIINQNQKILEILTDQEKTKDNNLNSTSFFLPLMLPELYDALAKGYRKRFEEQSLKAYLKTAERSHIQFEKSPLDYIKLFNAKGFYFGRKDGKIHISSHYSKFPVSIRLAAKTQAYLNSIKDLEITLGKQNKIIDSIKEDGRGQLENLWVTNMIERGLYGKAVFMLVHEGISPNLSHDVMEYHLENGLRDKILEVSKQKINAQQASVLRKSVYALSSLLGESGYKAREVYNGFKDEMTDYSKYKGIFL